MNDGPVTPADHGGREAGARRPSGGEPGGDSGGEPGGTQGGQSGRESRGEAAPLSRPNAPNSSQTVTDENGRETLLARQVMAEARFRVMPVCLVVLTGLACFYTLYFASEIVLPFVLAMVLALLLAPVNDALNRRLHLPRMLAAAIVILLLFAAVGALAYAISVPAAGWIARAPQSLPTLQQKLGFLRGPIDMVQAGFHQIQSVLSQSDEGGATITVKQNSGLPGLSVIAGTRQFLGQAFTVIVVLFFMLAEGDTLLRRFVEILPGLSEKKRTVQIAGEVERNISRYLATITAMNLLVGVASALSIWVLGLPDPLLWGTVAFLLNFVPIIGPITGVAIFFFVGLFSFSSVAAALAPAGMFLLIHIVEGQVVTPMLVARRFTLNPVLVIVALMFWDWMWGIPGALLAVPLLAVVKIVCDHIEALTPLGHLLGGEPPQGRARSGTI